MGPLEVPVGFHAAHLPDVGDAGCNFGWPLVIPSFSHPHFCNQWFVPSSSEHHAYLIQQMGVQAAHQGLGSDKSQNACNGLSLLRGPVEGGKGLEKYMGLGILMATDSQH